MNTTSPNTVRLTPAAYLLGLFFAFIIGAFVSYSMDVPFAYLGCLFGALLSFIGFADQAAKYGKF